MSVEKIVREFQDGSVETYEEVNGVVEGEYTLIGPNGNVRAKHFYVAGQLNGEIQEWNLDGVLVTHALFNNGDFVQSLK